MKLLTPLKNEKSAHAETPAMRHPSSRPVPPSLIPGLLNRSIIRPALLLLLFLIFSFSALAYDCEVAGIYYNLNTTDKTASVTKGKYNGDVTIPETIAYNNTTYSVISIGSWVFQYCSGLIKLVSLAVEPPSCRYKAFEDIDKAACRLFVPEESVDKYKTAEQWKEVFFISEYDGVDDVSVDTQDALYEVYNMQGVRVGSGMREAEVTADTLPHGIYILVSPQGRKKLKI